MKNKPKRKWLWGNMRFIWQGKKYEMNICRAEFLDLCKRLNLSKTELIDKILNNKNDFRLRNLVEIKIIKSQ